MHLSCFQRVGAHVLWAVNGGEDQETGDQRMVTNDDEGEQKGMSPLAMAAADWLEEEEDELSKYWERFDDAKRVDRTITSTDAISRPRTFDEQGLTGTTEQLLDSYYRSRGIDKEAETKHRSTIENAVNKASKAASAEEAVRYTQLHEALKQANPHYKQASPPTQHNTVCLPDNPYLYQDFGEGPAVSTRKHETWGQHVARACGMLRGNGRPRTCGCNLLLAQE